LATEAGARALAAGGNALDAALAAVATLCVVYPNNVSLGSDMVALVRDPAGKIRFLNATGEAPSGESIEALRERHGPELPLRGIDTITVPGAICGWNSLHELGASRPWARHFDAAIAHAAGHPTARSVAAALVEGQGYLPSDEGFARIFFPQGPPLSAGETLAQPALEATLKRLAAGGSAEFYEGETARAWVEGLNRLGSRISIDDLRSYQAFWGEPLSAEFRGHRVVTSPPNTSGFILLRALAAIDAAVGTPLGDDPLGAGAGDLARVFADANAVRAQSLADPRFTGASGAELIRMPAPAGATPGGQKPTGDTVGLSAVSADGWAISLINSVYWSFGSGILEPSTGILFQNRGTSFSLDPESPNAFAPGKRPRHTLMPVLVLRAEGERDELAWVPATMGGSAQPQIHTQLLLRSLAGASPAEATHAPRWVVEEPDVSGNVEVTVEDDVDRQAQESLAGTGLSLSLVPSRDENLGHSNLIRVEANRLSAASDPRSDGSAIVVT